jgi:hypothetical protein
MKMRLNYFLYAVLAVVLSSPAYANIFLGTCDGYVFDMSNGIIEGANVTATIGGCSGGESNGCVGSRISQSNGYYVIPNLNVNPGGTISLGATATISGHDGSGSASATANKFQAGRANITLCFAPDTPLLIYMNDSHNNSVIFYWNSGADPFGYSTYDQFQLDSGAIETKTSPLPMNVSYSSHTWKVRTCNSGCCSPFAENSFDIYNTPPFPPTLTDQENTHYANVTLYWTNGSDSDGDAIYHQFQFDSQPIQNNSLSPVAVSGISFGPHTWRVRACDFLECSNWAEDSFNRTNGIPPEPVLKPQGNTTSTTIKLNWTSGADPDNDPVHDEFQFSIYYDFSTNIISLANASPPVSIANLSSFEKYYWRVRTCDSGACSAWSQSSFVKYECKEGEEKESKHEGGGGAASLPAQKIAETIIPSPAIEVSAPVEATRKNVTEEIKKEISAITELPAMIAESFKHSVTYKLWWIFIALILAVIILSVYRNRKEKMDRIRKSKIDDMLKKI